MKDFNRNPDRESEHTPFIWEHKSEDLTIEVMKDRDENLYKAVERVGGYIEHEITEYVEDLEIAVSKAESYIKSGEEQ
jgi:hypothetical protein